MKEYLQAVRAFVRSVMSGAKRRAQSSTPRGRTGRARRSLYTKTTGRDRIQAILARNPKIAPHFHLLELGVKAHSISLKKARAFRIGDEFRTVPGGIRHPGLPAKNIIKNAAGFAAMRIRQGLSTAAARGIQEDLDKSLPRTIKAKL